jgi:hypothetical protein
MPENNQPDSPGTPGTGGTPDQSNPIDPELIRQVTDKVFAMLVEDLRIEQERVRYGTQLGRRSIGGR